MKEIRKFEEFVPGAFVFWQRNKDGLYQIVEVQNRGMALAPLLVLEKVYNTNYEKASGSKRNREFNVDANFCKIVNLDDLFKFEEQRFKRVQAMITQLKQRQ